MEKVVEKWERNIPILEKNNSFLEGLEKIKYE